ncbi:nitric oxide-associated protein 1 isoform X3 [Solenopsis invicta]|uniref:nitric oxide-associated protein 1 isoform X3 n=1 Tax=Solenopsis invicta TaxID=13686 RepID=UPI000E33DED8|nr:nitric oxide-associated protein 1 isoform X3 [Solenopsis invicta]
MRSPWSELLSEHNIKLITFTKYSAWKMYVGGTYRYLRGCRDKYQLIRAFTYSTKRNTLEDSTGLQCIQSQSLDPRVTALREKLIYCDYLDYQKVKVNYMKRFLLKKKFENNKKKAQIDKLTNTPVYSILLDTLRNDKESSGRHLEQERTNAEEKVAKPVHMPYASTDLYSNVDTPSNETNKNYVDENITLLNDKYKALYEKYLMEKSAALENREFTLQNYLEETDTTVSYKKDFSSNIPSNWMVDVEQYDDASQEDTWLNNYGTPDPNSNISSVPCGGCGALLHCKDQALPGYLPSELFLKRSERELQIMICQRCHFMQYYNTTLEVKVSADEYPELLKVIKTKKCAVILMVDLTDFPCSIWPEINSVLHPYTPVFVVGNKIDLLPQDSKHFFTHIKECLLKSVATGTGIKKENIKHVALVSAKTGYGIEELINKLHKIWKYKGDVYVIGCTNVGKSSLFNALLQSDYCKVQAVDLVQRATISPWPGTTLNLLKFPILNPLRWRLYLRTLRLQKEQQYKHAEEKFRIDQFKATHNLKYATLQSHIGRTFQSKFGTKVDDPFAEEKYKKRTQQFGLDETREEYKHSRWCYDTPGTIQPDQVLDLLTTQELLSVLPKKIISPRTFVLHVNQTIFLGGIGRLDYIEGNHFIRCTIFSSSELPVTLTRTEDADSVYNELLETEAFVVPENNPDRLKHWPALESKEMEVTGVGKNESIGDIVLSSAGWIAITAKEADRVLLRAWSPQGRGLYLRIPALLKKSVVLRGNRIAEVPTYKSGRQAYKQFL